MFRFKDVLFHIGLFLLWVISIILLIGFNLSYLFFISFVLFVAAKIYYTNSKKITNYVKDDFAALGYELLTERAYRFSESKTPFRLYTGIRVNNIPLERFYYLVRYSRVFTAKGDDGNTYTLFTRVTKEWNGTNTIEIREKQSTGL